MASEQLSLQEIIDRLEKLKSSFVDRLASLPQSKVTSMSLSEKEVESFLANGYAGLEQTASLYLRLILQQGPNVEVTRSGDLFNATFYIRAQS